jgi:hypothetical protein
MIAPAAVGCKFLWENGSNAVERKGETEMNLRVAVDIAGGEHEYQPTADRCRAREANTLAGRIAL